MKCRLDSNGTPLAPGDGYARWTIETAYSPHDGGHYAEVWTRSGRTVHTTEVADCAAKAIALAREWCDRQRERDTDPS